MAAPKLGFGIEIEAVLVLKEAQRGWGPIQCYKQLADALRRKDLPAIHDSGTSGYRKHPEHYGRWFITRDGSLRQSSGCGRFRSPKATRAAWCSLMPDIILTKID